MPDREVIQELLPHLSASEWRTAPEVAERSRRSIHTVRYALSRAAYAGIVKCDYVQRPGDRVMKPRPAYRLPERRVP